MKSCPTVSARFDLPTGCTGIWEEMQYILPHIELSMLQELLHLLHLHFCHLRVCLQKIHIFELSLKEALIMTLVGRALHNL